MSNPTPLLSVIIPVFNVEKYLSRCIDSIIHQSYQTLEIIIINDGSTDNSKSICEEYARIDSRIILINKENGGQSSARNSGLEIAKGDYITFVDSDDYIDLNTYTVNIKLLIENRHIEIIQFPIKYSNMGLKTPDKPRLISGEKNIFANWWTNDIITSSMCDKIFKKEVFKTIRFPEGQIYEDHFLIVDLSEIVQNVYLSNKGCYHYVIRESSTTNTIITINQSIDFFRAHVKVYAKLYSYEELRPYRLTAFSRVYRKLITAKRLDYNTDLSIYINMLGKYIPTWKDVIHTASGFKERVWILCVKILGINSFLNIYSRYLNIKKAKNSL